MGNVQDHTTMLYRYEAFLVSLFDITAQRIDREIQDIPFSSVAALAREWRAYLERTVSFGSKSARIEMYTEVVKV